MTTSTLVDEKGNLGVTDIPPSPKLPGDKEPQHSKTLWFNLIALLLLCVLIYDNVVRHTEGLVAGITIIGNLYLRCITCGRIIFKGDTNG